jgi:hypothetical protein
LSFLGKWLFSGNPFSWRHASQATGEKTMSQVAIADKLAGISLAILPDGTRATVALWCGLLRRLAG